MSHSAFRLSALAGDTAISLAALYGAFLLRTRVPLPGTEALLPPANVKARFYVPEPELASLRQGQAVLLSCDGCGAPIAARISYISPQPEYTPPVIYSNSQRARLVFLVEARPDPAQATRLHPGQPLEVRPSAGAAPATAGAAASTASAASGGRP